MPKYPNVTVRLVGEDGNAFAIIGRARLAMQRAGLPGSEVAAFSTEATSGDYGHLLMTVMNWFDTGDYEDEDGDDAEWDAYWASCDDDHEDEYV